MEWGPRSCNSFFVFLPTKCSIFSLKIPCSAMLRFRILARLMRNILTVRWSYSARGASPWLGYLKETFEIIKIIGCKMSCFIQQIDPINAITLAFCADGTPDEFESSKESEKLKNSSPKHSNHQTESSSSTSRRRPSVSFSERSLKAIYSKISEFS